MGSENMITLTTPCREWRGARNEHGYGLRARPIRRLHRWVMAQVHGEEAIRGRVVMHLCDNPPCFRYDHLRLATQGENTADAYAKGRRLPRRKLSSDDVTHIRNSDETQRALAARFGVAQSLISMIRTGGRRTDG